MGGVLVEKDAGYRTVGSEWLKVMKMKCWVQRSTRTVVLPERGDDGVVMVMSLISVCSSS